MIIKKMSICSVWVAALSMVLLTLTATVAIADVFPAAPFNGLQVSYSVSGATLGTPKDSEGFTFSRSITGTLTGSELTVSGVATAGLGWGATIDVSVRVDGEETKTFQEEKFPEGGLMPDPMSQPFTVTVPIPAEAESASFSIRLVGSYNAGTRGVVVEGTLDRSASSSSSQDGDGATDQNGGGGLDVDNSSSSSQDGDGATGTDGEEFLQWAAWATASSEYSSTDWSALQATGEPDTYPAHGDIETAWASLEEDAGIEWLDLEYEIPVLISRVEIYETYNPGAITGIEIYDQNGGRHLAWEGSMEPAITARISPIEIDADFPSDRIRIILDTRRVSGWNEIDAVALIGTRSLPQSDLWSYGDVLVDAPPGGWEGVEQGEAI